MRKIFAVIPARKSSKRIKNKNKKLFAGKHLVEWSMIASKKSKLINDVVVSTDDKAIKEISKKYKINVPKLRPKILSNDKASMLSVLKYIVREKKIKDDEIIVLLQPTSPLRDNIHIDEAIKKFFKLKAKSLVSVVETPIYFHPHKLLNIKKNFLIPHSSKESLSSFKLKNSKKIFTKNGPAILITYGSNIKKNDLYKNPVAYYEMKPEDSIDINLDWEFQIAEFLMRKKLSKIKKRK